MFSSGKFLKMIHLKLIHSLSFTSFLTGNNSKAQGVPKNVYTL